MPPTVMVTLDGAGVRDPKLRDASAALVDAHPNIEVRLFNAWRTRALAGRAEARAAVGDALGRVAASRRPPSPAHTKRQDGHRTCAGEAGRGLWPVGLRPALPRVRPSSQVVLCGSSCGACGEQSERPRAAPGLPDPNDARVPQAGAHSQPQRRAPAAQVHGLLPGRRVSGGAARERRRGLVNVPSPARFAIHKLIVHGFCRSCQTRAAKDSNENNPTRAAPGRRTRDVLLQRVSRPARSIRRSTFAGSTRANSGARSNPDARIGPVRAGIHQRSDEDRCNDDTYSTAPAAGVW